MGDDPNLITLRISGHLGPLALAAFPAMVADQQGPDTILTGLLPDRSAFFGILAEVETLGLDLLEMRKRAPPSQSSDDSMLSAVVASAPEVATKLVAPLFDTFDDLAEDEQQELFETFHAWVEADGSLYAAADLLCCHHITVRARLHSIEEHTGRSLTRPRELAELCFAFEVRRRLR
ncbi:helix-turn-helix domain-containing protein [Nocardia sp. NBC_01499]|uniref:helix-turn-helix domain-containing protein n=1 Tax=Nocardia sp. NBC_01499 TaxID=2903597 RepID=UPI00386CA889